MTGSWDTSMKCLDIPYYAEITILGFRFTIAVACSGNVSWSKATGKVKVPARDACCRDLCLEQRIQYAHTFLLFKTWHTARIFTTPMEQVRRLLTARFCYIWRDAILSLPLWTLKRQAEKRNGLDRCRSQILRPFSCKSLYPRYRSGSPTAEWLKVWASQSRRKKPHTKEWSLGPWNTYAFISTTGRVWNLTGRPKQGRLLNEGCMTTCELCLLRRQNIGRCASFQLQPTVDRSLVWGNLHNVIFPDAARTAWYMVIHDMIVTNVNLHKIRLPDTEYCTQCERQNTILHLLTEFGARKMI